MANSNNPDIEPLSRTQILVAMGVTALILLIVAQIWLKVASISLLNWELSLEALLLAMGIAAGVIAASSIIYRLWPAYRRSAHLYLELILKPLVWPDLIWLGLLPGLSEELLFRGVILPSLGLNLIAVIISSFLFGILHLNDAQQWPYAVWATVVGFILGYAALLTNNLLVPIFAHILINFVSSVLWKTKQAGGFSST